MESPHLQSDGLAALKKQKKKIDRIKKKNIDDKNDDGTKKTIFEVDFNTLKQGLDPELLRQIVPLVEFTEENFNAYKEHLQYQDRCETEGPSITEQTFRDREMTDEEVRKYHNLGSTDLDPRAKNHLASDCIIWERVPIDQEVTLGMLKQLYAIEKLDHTIIAKQVRKISVVTQVLLSPYLRTELDSFFDLWAEALAELVRTKFCAETLSAATESESEVDTSGMMSQTIEVDKTDIGESLLNYSDEEGLESLEQTIRGITVASISQYDDMDIAEDEIDLEAEVYKHIKYDNKINFGGILKQLLAPWTCEDVFNTSISVFYWLIGFIRLKEHKNKSDWVFECRKVLVDTDIDDEDEYVKLCIAKSKDPMIGVELIESLARLIFGWIRKQKHLESRLKDPSKFKINLKKIKNLDLARLLNVRLAPRSFFDKLCQMPILKDIMTSVDKDIDMVCRLSKSDIEKLVAAENSYFCDNIRFRKSQYYCGKESYLPLSYQKELTPTDLENWLLSNLMGKSYVPLVSACHHYSNSVIDFTSQGWVKDSSQSVPANLFKSTMKTAQISETVMEIQTFLIHCERHFPQEHAQLRKMVQDKKMSDFARHAMTVAWRLYDKLVSDTQEFYLDAVEPNKASDMVFCEHMLEFLDNKLSNQDTKAWGDLILGEAWIRFAQRIDSSLILSTSVEPMMKSLIKDLEKLKLKECKHSLVPSRKVFSQEEENCEPVLITFNKNKFTELALRSEETADFYVKLADEIIKLLVSVIVKSTATASANSLYSKVKEDFVKLEENNMNEEPPIEFRYRKEKKNYFELPKKLKDKVKRVRRLVPEFRCGELGDMVIPRDIWIKLEEFTVNCYWKVQLGLVTWWALMVEGSTWEYDVLIVLRKVSFNKVRSRDAAIKIMSTISDHFKIHTEPIYQTKYKELLNIPYWVFSGADTIFGFTNENELESKTWKEDTLKNIVDWIGKFEPEAMRGLDLNYDFEMGMEHFLRDFKPTYSPYNLEFFDVSQKIINKQSDLAQYEMKNIARYSSIQRDPTYYYPNDESGIVVVNDFFSWCKSFLKFSVDGSAQGLRIDVDKLYVAPSVDEIEETTEDGESMSLVYQRELEQAQTSDAYGRNRVSNQQVKLPSPEDTSGEMDARPDSNKKYEEAVDKAIEQKIREEQITEQKNAKKKSLTKTLAFALGGKNLARLLFWAGGDQYVPELNIHLKIEKKKIRLVANSDVVSFNKQNYLYEWINRAIGDTSKELVYTFIHPRDKVKRVERFSSCFRSEKWQCPMDLKDFHSQFGPVHHRTLMRCLWRRVDSITCPNIRKEMQYIVSSLHEELCKGLIYFRKKTDEDFTKAKEKLTVEQNRYIKLFECNKKKPPGIDPFEDLDYTGDQDDVDPDYLIPELQNESSNFTDTAINEDKNKNSKNEGDKFETFIAFDIKNGLLSGWKMTSMLGSFYNYSTNNMINFWSLFFFSLIPTDYATQGDDTHFKTRYLISSLFHTAFVNSIGKIAHPQKQFFSTRFTEFLKKTYDMWTKEIRYQPCRIISSLLFENEEKENKANGKNMLKDFVDMWNMFFTRIPGNARTHFVHEILQLPAKSLQVKFNWHSKKGKGGYYDLDLINKMLSGPEMVSSFLSGPMTNPDMLCKRTGKAGEFKPYSEYTRAEMKDYFLEFKHGLNVHKWSGIKSQSNSIIRRMSTNRKTNFGADPALRADIQSKIFEAIGESLKEYSQPSPLGTIKTYKLCAKTDDHLKMYMIHREEMLKEIESNMIDYLHGYDIATPFCQLMVMNNSFSKNIEGVLRSSKHGAALSNFEIYEVLSGFNGKCKFVQGLYKKLADNMDPRVLFAFALNGDLGVSVTRNVIHDEYLGTISLIISESLPLLLTSYFSLKGLDYDEEAQRDLVNNLILFLEIDLFLSKALDFVKLLRDTSYRSLLAEPF